MIILLCLRAILSKTVRSISTVPTAAWRLQFELKSNFQRIRGLASLATVILRTSAVSSEGVILVIFGELVSKIPKKVKWI